MMFSNGMRFLFGLGAVSLILFGSYVNHAVAQTTLEATDTVRLYEKVADSDRVPVITCIDLEKTGRLLAVGGDDQLVRLWDVNAKNFIRQLPEHLDWVRGLAFSPDQTRLATLGQDGQIKLWDVQNGSLIRTIKTSVRGGQKIQFHPNGSQFAVCGFDQNVRIYDSATGSLLNTLETHGTNNRAIAFSPNGASMAVAGRTGVIRVWRTSDYQKLRDLPGDGRRVHAVAFSQDGTQLVSGGEGPFIFVWKLADGSSTMLPERPGKTFSLVFCGNDMIASGESDNAIRIWDIRQKTNTATLLGHTGTVSTMIYESTANRLITGSFDTSLRFWTLPGSVPAATIQTSNTNFTAPTMAAPLAESPFAEPVNTATPSSFPITF